MARRSTSPRTGVDAADDEILDDSEFELRSRASGAALSSLAPPPPVAGSERTEYVTHDVTGEGHAADHLTQVQRAGECGAAEGRFSKSMVGGGGGAAGEK